MPVLDADLHPAKLNDSMQAVVRSPRVVEAHFAQVVTQSYWIFRNIFHFPDESSILPASNEFAGQRSPYEALLMKLTWEAYQDSGGRNSQQKPHTTYSLIRWLSETRHQAIFRLNDHWVVMTRQMIGGDNFMAWLEVQCPYKLDRLPPYPPLEGESWLVKHF